jgi:hypothetical protein
MSYFNQYQQAHMESLHRTPPESLCWCGWNLKGQCHNCDAHYSSADKLPHVCKVCGNPPNSPTDLRVTHMVICTVIAEAVKP